MVLSASEVQQLLDALALRERTLVLLDVGTGLRMSELFGLKWKDVDFDANEISVVRSIVMQVTGPCKTESSQKPIPLDPYLAEALRAWLEHVRYNRPEDWVFANPRMKGRQPYWGQEIMRRVIRPIALQLGITKHIGWHTFRHRIRPFYGQTGRTSKLCRNCSGTPPVGSRWTPIHKQSRHKNAKRRVE